MARADERKREIDAVVAEVRAIEEREGVTRESLEKIKQRLTRLAARQELFTAEDFPPPAHNHTTWAVIVGVSGEELNCFYDRAEEGGVREKGRYVVKQGTGVTFMPEDLHSIHIQAPLINFHMYGLGLDQLHKREFYKADEKAWRVFPAHADIREAR